MKIEDYKIPAAVGAATGAVGAGLLGGNVPTALLGGAILGVVGQIVRERLSAPRGGRIDMSGPGASATPFDVHDPGQREAFVAAQLTF